MKISNTSKILLNLISKRNELLIVRSEISSSSRGATLHTSTTKNFGAEVPFFLLYILESACPGGEVKPCPSNLE